MDVRPGEERDLEQVNEIYNFYVRTSPATFDLDEVTMHQRRGWFEGFDGGRYHLFVADEDGRILGWASTKPLHERRAYDISCVSTAYVRDGEVGKGIGRALYAALFDAIAGEDLHRVYAGISMPNDASVALHESFGFKQCAYYTEQGRKFDRYWDVAWFEKAL